MTASKSAPRNTYSLLLSLLHIFCLAVYLYPILTYRPPTPKHGGPTLDELHIMSESNRDVNDIDNTQWTDVFLHDYWGRPMNSESSHKSWRPLTVLSFRWLQMDLGTSFLKSLNRLNMHRVVNVITHAAAAECVSILAVQVFPSSQQQQFYTRILSKLLFTLHPTHVEVTANAANRPHILAVLLSCVLSDPSTHVVWFLLLSICGFLTSETFIFQLPAIVLTMTVIRVNQKERVVVSDEKQQQDEESSSSFRTTLIPSLKELFPRYLSLFLLAVFYMAGRYYYDTLSIPDGLIRPAENPFYEFQSWHRVRNYSYVISLHLNKSVFLDFLGFSHEYGFDCIPAIDTWSDVRLILPLGWLGILCVVSLICLQRGWKPTLILLWHLSFCATLFPISGVVKVGTFVADRITVASTVSVCILLANSSSRLLQNHVNVDMTTTTTRRRKDKSFQQQATILPLLLFLCFFWYRVHTRTLQWMDSEALLQSSLKTCPRSAKSHLEVSKIYSGLYPSQLNLSRSLYHLETAQSIDPNYCDVHQQFAHVYIQQSRYHEFEQHLYQGILCPFSMGGSMELWRRYWQTVLQSGDPTARERMDAYNRKIEAAVQEERRKAKEGQGSKYWSSADESNHDDDDEL